MKTIYAQVIWTFSISIRVLRGTFANGNNGFNNYRTLGDKLPNGSVIEFILK
jgi:hypothetical protein